MFKRKTPLSKKSPLEQYVDDLNVFRRLREADLLEEPFSRDDVAYIADRIEGDLSPENLNCDGEISRAEANRKWKFLMEVQDELTLHDDWGVTYR